VYPDDKWPEEIKRNNVSTSNIDDTIEKLLCGVAGTFVYLYFWYSGSEYLLGGVFTEKQIAIDHLEREWANDPMQLYSKSFYVVAAQLNEAKFIDPYRVPDTDRIFPAEVAKWNAERPRHWTEK